MEGRPHDYVREIYELAITEYVSEEPIVDTVADNPIE